MVPKPLPAYEGDDRYFFVSYAHDDAEPVFAEMRWLQDAGYNLWYDEGIHAGNVWRRALADALTRCSGVIFFCTARSSHSENCLQEINFALEENKQVFVVQLDDAPMPPELRLSLSLRQNIRQDPGAPEDGRRKLTRALGEPANVRFNDNHPDREAENSITTATTDHAGHLGWPSITVIPARVRRDDAEVADIADDLFEDLVSFFPHFQWKTVAGTDADASLTDIDVGARDATRLVLRTKIRRAGSEVQISTRLMNAGTGEQISRFSVEAELDSADPVRLASTLTMRTLDELRRVEAKRVDGLPIEALDAFGCLCKRFSVSGRPTRDSQMDRIEFGKRAIELAPDKAHCYADTALAMIGVSNMLGVPPDEVVGWGLLDFAERAVTLSPHDNLSLLAACWAHRHAGDPAVGLEYAERAHKLYHRVYSPHIHALIALGRAEEAAMLDHEADPLDLAHALIASGKTEAAVDMYRKAVARHSTWHVWIYLSNALGLVGKHKEARDALDRGTAINPGFSLRRWERGMRTMFRHDEHLVRLFCQGLPTTGADRESG